MYLIHAQVHECQTVWWRQHYEIHSIDLDARLTLFA